MTIRELVDQLMDDWHFIGPYSQNTVQKSLESLFSKAEAEKKGWKRGMEEAAEIAENGQSGCKGDPSHLIAYDFDSVIRPNAFNTCLRIANAIRAAIEKKERE